MEAKLEKKYGLFTAIAMVVGIVIGSGIFFKTEAVLKVANGNVSIGILALLIVGIIMIICSYAFSILATRYEKVNGVVDYAEVALGPKYGYYVGWFMTFIYYPTLTSVLAWVSARYTCVLFGVPDPFTSGGCLAIACFYLVAVYAMNALSPILAGKFQVSATVIKLVPLVLMAVVGTFAGIGNGTLASNFAAVSATASGTANPLFAACVATAFSYEGWIIATSINAELKDSKKNLPRALIIGSLIVVVVYICYYLGINGSVTTGELLAAGSTQAFVNTFGSVGGSILTVFIVISCLGTCNGLMLGCVRGMYSIAVRGEGPRPDVFRQVDPVTNMPTNSSILGVLLCGVWLLYFFGGPLMGWFGPFSFDSSELPIVTLYGAYVPIFIMMMRKEKDLGTFNRYVAPILAICGCVFMVAAAIFGHRMLVVYYLIVFAVVMAFGVFFSKKQK